MKQLKTPTMFVASCDLMNAGVDVDNIAVDDVAAAGEAAYSYGVAVEDALGAYVDDEKALEVDGGGRTVSFLKVNVMDDETETVQGHGYEQHDWGAYLDQDLDQTQTQEVDHS